MSSQPRPSLDQSENDLQYLTVKRIGLADPSLQAEWAEKRYVWVPDPKEGFLFGSILEELSGECLLVKMLETGKEVTVGREDVQTANPPKFDKVEDMSSLSFLNEASVLHNLRQRYYSSLIYTYSGLFCVVVNPYKRMPMIYSEAVVERYRGRKRHEVPPHVFAVTDGAYRSLLHEHEDQSILCTGESGAGKTENTKKVIQYLAHIAGPGRHGRNASAASPFRKLATVNEQLSAIGQLEDQLLQANPILEAFGNSKTVKNDNSSRFGQLEDQLLQANPILEAFGNSKTVKNDNSSRFGKFIRINFDQSGYISGANIEHYLLEKSRTVTQAPDERSFHFFYQLVKGADENRKKALLLEELNNYRFLSNGSAGILNVDDAAEFSRTISAMKIMGFVDSEIDAIMRTVSAVLLLGNMAFSQERTSDQALLDDDTVAQKVSCLLGLPTTDLIKAFLRPRVKVGRDYVHKSQSQEQAQYAVEAIAKACYERMFRWLVNRINRSLSRTSRTGSAFIGILDIAGFEIFEINSFEQLCINYTNEKLQQLFNSTMFVLEQEEYRREGIPWDFIDFGLDLQPTIDLIEKPMGILALLDEQCLFPKATDKSLVEKLIVNQSKHPKFVVPEMRAKSDFAVIHYAGRVDYSADHWLTKNMDPLNDSVVLLLQNSSNSFVAGIWKDVEFASIGVTESANDIFGARTKKGMFRTTGHLYKEQLSRLMSTLQNTCPHFVRCIIPNREKKAGVIVAPLVLEQLRCNGVLEGIRICRQGFPNRILFQEFRQRYETLLARGALPLGFMDGREAVNLKMTDMVSKKCEMGKLALSKLLNIEEERSFALLHLYKSDFYGLSGLCAIKFLYEFNSRLITDLKLCDSFSSSSVLANWPSSFKNFHLTYEKKQLIGAVNNERVQLQEQLQAESVEKLENEEMKERLVRRIEELKEQLTNANHQIEEDETKLEKSADARRKLQENLHHLEEQLEVEERAHQKLMLDKTNAEQKLRAVLEERDQLEQFNQKLSKEKGLGDERVAELSASLASEEDKCRQLTKQRARLDMQLADLEQQLSREKNNRSLCETAKRQLLTEKREMKDSVEELQKKLDELNAVLVKKNEELLAALTRCDEEQAQRQTLAKQLRDAFAELQETKEDLVNERSLRSKSERGKRDYMEELEALKQELLESQDKTQAVVELRTQREKQFDLLKKELEETTASFELRINEMKQKHAKQVEALNDEIEQLKRLKHQKELEETTASFELRINEMKQKHAKQVEALNDEIEQLKRLKHQSEKSKELAESELCEKRTMLEQFQCAKSDAEKRRKTAESNLVEWQTRATDAEAERSSIAAALAKAQVEIEQLYRSVELKDEEIATLQQKVADLGCQQFQCAKSDAEKRRKTAESNLVEWQTRATDAEAERSSIAAALAKAQVEIEQLYRSVELKDEEIATLQQKVADLGCQLTESTERFAVEQSQKSALQGKLRDVEQELEMEREIHEDDEKIKQKMEKEIANLKDQLVEMKKKNDDEALEQAEEARKKVLKELEACQKQLEEVEAARMRSEKAKKKLIQENEDAKVELDKVTAQCREMEKKQRKFDQQLAEESANAARIAAERDQLAQDLRERDSKALVTAKEMDEIRFRLDETERSKRALQLELDDVMATKDDAGRNAHELERAKRALDAEVMKMREEIVELEDSYQSSEDARLRLEVNLQTAKSELQKALADKERDNEEKRKSGQRRIRELEDELELERRAKASVLQLKKKVDAHLHEALSGMDTVTKQRDDLARQLRKITQAVKDLQQELDEARTGKESAILHARDSDRKLRTAEGEVSQLAEINAQLNLAKRKIETERDDLAEELATKSLSVGQDEKKRLEAKIVELEELIEEEQSGNELLNDKLKKAQNQVEALTTELTLERSLCEKTDGEKKTLEQKNRELEEKISELVRDDRARAKIVSLESKIQNMEDQYALEVQDKNVALRQVRRLEKKLTEAAAALDEEKRNAEVLKESVDRANTRCRDMRRQFDEIEEQASRERSKMRLLQRTIDELNETNEALSRENAQLKSSAALARRTGMARASSSRFGSDLGSLGRGVRSVSGESTELRQQESASTQGSAYGEDNDFVQPS
ncbi:Myosin-9 [Toxocara canis]|uniref:Myosin-9 n=1 Tax=Toxocara canis TaxID=6265 RepID=A0A0B2VTY5_TOXCA|nr:Myosin-9 [Toxocara canis]